MVQIPENVTLNEDGKIILTVKAVEEIRIKFDKTEEAIIQNSVESEMEIPQQLSQSEIQITEKFNQVTDMTSNILLPGSIILNFFLSSFLQFLWGLMNDMSFLISLTLISITVPGIAQTIQGTLLSFIYLDILQTDKWIPSIMFAKDHDDQPLNSYFLMNGFQSTNLIKNLGSTFVYLLVVLMSYFILYVLGLLARLNPVRFARPMEWLKKQLCWNLAIRFVIQQYPPLLLSSLINLYDVNFNSFGDALGALFSFLIVTSALLAISYSLKLFITSNSSPLPEKFDSLYQKLNTNKSQIAKNWTFIVLYKWTLAVLNYVLLRDYAFFQIQILLFMSFINQVLLIIFKPMSLPSDNRLQLFNEFMVSIYLYILMGLTDFNKNGNQQQLGFALAITVLFSAFANFCNFLYQITKNITLKLSQKYSRQKVQKESQEFVKKYSHDHSMTLDLNRPNSVSNINQYSIDQSSILDQSKYSHQINRSSTNTNNSRRDVSATPNQTTINRNILKVRKRDEMLEDSLNKNEIVDDEMQFQVQRRKGRHVNQLAAW